MEPTTILAIVSAIASPFMAWGGLRAQMKAVQERLREDKMAFEKAIEKAEKHLADDIQELRNNKAEKLEISSLMARIEQLENHVQSGINTILSELRSK